MLVSFPSGALTLRGHLHVPDGDGPFPGVVWNHGSERERGSQEGLARFYTSAGYALFIPHRRGHGQSPGEHFQTVAGPHLKGMPRAQAVELLIRHHELQLQDTLAAVAWISAQPFVDAGRVAVSGVSHGGIQTLLAAEVATGPRAYAAFAPGAIGWDGNPELQDRLLRAVERASCPIFLIQAANDHSLGPSEVLGEALTLKGAHSKARVYPAFGETPGDGHGAFACFGSEVWGADVLAFLSDVLTAPSSRRPRSASSGLASSAASR
jgi:dienelactone hydrolase